MLRSCRSCTAHDDLALDAEWSDEERGCTGDGPHPQEQGKRVREEIDMFKMIFKMFQMFNKFYWRLEILRISAVCTSCVSVKFVCICVGLKHHRKVTIDNH